MMAELQKMFSRHAARFVLIPALMFVPGWVAVAAETPTLDSVTQEEIAKFCGGIADPARDQRYLLQKEELEKLQADIDSRIVVLEDRRTEYEDWLKRRNDFLRQAEIGLVEIYKKMKPDAAAPALAEINVELAASIIMKLPPRQSALVLSEMEPKKAAMVSAIISSAADPNTSKEPT